MEISTTILDNITFLTIKGTEYHQMPINNIVAIQVIDSKYVEITTTCNKHYVLTPLKSISIYLDNFVTVNKGFIVNKYYIVKLVKQEKDKTKYNLVLRGPANGFWTIEISDYLAKRLLEQL